MKIQISSRFTIAVHTILCIATFSRQDKVTSDYIAGSVSVNPVVVRKILGQLKMAGLVTVKRGSGGAEMAKPLDDITFFDVYKAVECVGEGALFHFHENPNPDCPLGHCIHAVLDSRLEQVQQAMEQKLASIKLSDVKADADKYLNAMQDGNR